MFRKAVVGVRPLVNYQHTFENTYLWGSYSPITGDSFVWEINGVDSKIFEHYLKALSEFKPREYKVVVIDNAAFHNTTNFEVPDNIYLLNILTLLNSILVSKFGSTLKNDTKTKPLRICNNLDSGYGIWSVKCKTI